ncbi:hypothetical protein R497_24715 [Salmonella enterica subsp. enterica serovar Havana]|nr:hypothetical protein [Salmonella enterica]EBX0472603.1 hypothetical protein [Salmonella enterica subsp. enterica serovar Havana]EBX8404907.1 hypothetical protein [Salmonella enterica subsp. enterica serovar Oranienburg]EAW1072264.1 hypothetical protein [Salmonella enterica]EAY1112506.1 hypothetical protein [Salmonella enterica]
MNKERYRASLMLVGILLSTQAQAWIQGGTGGEVDLGGTIDPAEPGSPWEVSTGKNISSLEFTVNQNASVASIAVQQSYPVLGIRTRLGKETTFKGNAAGGITPQISYTGLVTAERYNRGRLPFSLPVTSPDGARKIGVLEFQLLAVAEVSRFAPAPELNNGLRFSVFASQPGEAFFGGIARNNSEVIRFAQTMAGAHFPEYTEKYNPQGLIASPRSDVVSFTNPDRTYSGFYAAGLVSGDKVIMRLNEGYQLNAAEQWKAQLGITVKYL